MKIRIKQQGFLGEKRTEDISSIDEIMVKEDLLSPEKATVHLYFKGAETSGILTFTKNELERLTSLNKHKGIIAKKKKNQ